MAAFYSCLRGKKDCAMASGPAAVSAVQEPPDTTEECTGRKKSRFQTFKNFFAKKKRKDPTAADEGVIKSGQSSDDVDALKPAPILTDKDSDSGSNIQLGNKALSNDSVFASDSPSSETNEALCASQDSVQGKVKSLQLQLQQTIRMGSPAISGRSGEDSAMLSEDDGLPCSPPEDSSFSCVLPESSQRSSDVIQRMGSLSLEESDSEDDQMSSGASSRPSTPQATIPMDFSHPASSLSCLDSSAARHRIAVNTQACAKRKPASREMLQSKKRDLRERVLLRDTEDKLRAVGVFTEEEENKENTEVGKETTAESSSVCSVLEQSEEEPPAYTQSQPSSRTSDASAEYLHEEECDEDQVPSMEFSEPSWHNAVTLELQSDDFLLDAGCEVVSEEQGSLLEEVLSSLRGPLSAGLVRESEDMVEQMKVKEVTGEDVPNVLAEDNATELLDFTGPNSTLEEQIMFVENTLSKSAEHLGEAEETSETEEKPVKQELCEEAPLEDLQVPEGEPEYEYLEHQDDVRKAIDEEVYEERKIMKEVDEVSGGSSGGDEEEEAEEKYMEENGKEEMGWESKDDEENEVENTEVVDENVEDAEEDEIKQVEESVLIDETCPPEKEELGMKVDKASIEVGSFQTSDECLTILPKLTPPLTEVVSRPEDLPACPAQESVEQPSFVVTTSVNLSFPSRVSNIPKLTKESEDETETLQEEANEQHDIVEEVQDRTSGSSQLADEQQVAQEVLSESHQPSASDSQHQLMITPALQKSLSSGAVRELSQPVRLSAAEGEPALTGSTSSDQCLDDAKAERPPSPVRTRSAPSFPLPRESSQEHEETTPENPFGVRLRKTAMLHRYASEGESPSPTTQPESPETQQTISDQLARKPALPKKPDQVAEGAGKTKRSPDLVVGKASLETSEHPSWISMARQKQKLFKENSLEECCESKVSLDDEFIKKDSLPDLSSPVTKDVASLLKPVASPVKVACSLEISKPSMVDKESKRMAGHLPPAPHTQEEPPWLALAKKKAKAWSEMPQIVQ